MRSAPVGVLLPIAPQLVAQRIDANKYYRAAISTPQLVDALELRAAALQARSALPRIPAVPLPTNAVDLEAWLEAVAHTGELERQRATRDDALAHLIARQDALVGSIAADADRALAILNTAMTEVMGIASVLVSRLGGHHNAAAIVAAGDPDVLAAWQDMRRLRADEYDQIRAAEGWIRAGDPRELNYRSNWLYNDDLASDFTASNMDDLFPQWKQRKPEFAIISATDQPQADPRPWPNDPVEQLVWMITAGARMWVPTWAQLGELGRQRRRDRAHSSGGKQPPQRKQKPLPQRADNSSSELLNRQMEMTP